MAAGVAGVAQPASRQSSSAAENPRQRDLIATSRPRIEIADLIQFTGQRRAGQRARRWVVEGSHSWTNRARRLLVRWEKKADNYLAFVHLQFAYIALNQAGVLG